MAQPTTRLRNLMSYIGWRKVTEWNIINNRYQKKHIPIFKGWLRKNLVFIEDEKTREVLEGYYLNNTEHDYSSGVAMYLKAGKLALYAAYKKDREYGYDPDEDTDNFDTTG